MLAGPRRCVVRPAAAHDENAPRISVALGRNEASSEDGVHRLSFALRVAGAAVGLVVFAAAGLHLGWPGASWLVNVGLAKLALVGAGGLFGAGVVVERVARRADARRLSPPAG